MIRKTLTTISLIGLLLSLGLWGVSYCGVSVVRNVRHVVGVDALDYFKQDAALAAFYGRLYIYFESPVDYRRVDFDAELIRLASGAPFVDTFLVQGEPEMSSEQPSIVEEEVIWLFERIGSMEYRAPITPIGRAHHESSSWLPVWAISTPHSSFFGAAEFLVQFERTMVSVPLYLTTLVFTVLPGHALVSLYRRRKRRKLGLCLKCGYDLRGSRNRCPECGEAFESP